MNKPITVSYAFKKDGKGERHGSAAGSYFLPDRMYFFQWVTIFYWHTPRTVIGSPSKEKSKSAEPFVCRCSSTYCSTSNDRSSRTDTSFTTTNKYWNVSSWHTTSNRFSNKRVRRISCARDKYTNNNTTTA